MSDVFISYSRKNIDFAKTLVEALKAKGRDTWIDLDEIPASAEWWAEIKRGIDAAHTFVPIITPESLSSPVCMFEMDYALKSNKRIIPIMRQQSDIDRAFVDMAKLKPTGFLAEILGDADMLVIARSNWRKVETLNWIFFREGEDFDAAVEVLLRALDTDLDRVRLIARLLTRAREWEVRGRDPSYLLVGTDLRDATSWLTVYGDEAPRATEEHRTYIQASLEEEKRQQRRIRRTSWTLRLLILLFLAAFIAGIVQTGNSLEQTNIANTAIVQAQNERDRADISISDAENHVSILGATLTPIPLMLTEANERADTLNTQAAVVATQVRHGEENVALLLGQQAASILNREDGNAEVATLLAIRSLKLNYTEAAEAALFRATDRLSTRLVMNSHIAPVSSAAFSPDGRLAISSSLDSTLRLWDVTTGEMLRTFTGHTDSVYSVAFSPDGHTIISGSRDHMLRLWDVTTGEMLHTFTGHTDSVNSVAFSPDGRTVLSGSTDLTLRLWDVATGKILRIFATNTVTSVAFSPDGRMVLSGSLDRTMRLWDVTTGEMLHTFTGHIWNVNSVAFSPDGQTVLSGSADRTMRLWDVATGETLRTFTGHTSFVNSVAFSPDGHMALSGSGKIPTDREYSSLRLWDVGIGKTPHTFIGHTSTVNSVAFSADGRTALSGSADNTMRLWDVATGEMLHTFTGHTDSVNSVAFSPDGRTALSGSADNTMRLWDLGTEETLHIFEGHSDDVWSVAFSLAGQTAISYSKDGTTREWDIATGEPFSTAPTTYIPDFNVVAFSPDGQTALSRSEDSALHLRDITTGETLRTFTFTGHTNYVLSAVFSQDGRTALTASLDRTVRLWEVATGKTRRIFTGHTNGVVSVAFSPDEQLALSGSGDGTLRLWNVAIEDFITYSCSLIFRDFTDTERQEYGIDDTPTCERFSGWTEALPTLTPIYTATFPVWTPIPSPTNTPTFTPTFTPLPANMAQIGDQGGEIAIGGGEVWTYAGETGEIITIQVIAEDTATLDTFIRVYAPDGHLLSENDDGDQDTNSEIIDLNFSTTGIYRIEVRSFADESGGGYTLSIESRMPSIMTPTPTA